MRQLETSDSQPRRFSQPLGIGGRCCRKNNGELLTAIPRDQIDLALDQACQLRRHPHEAFVATLMSLRIVQSLKWSTSIISSDTAVPGSLQARAFHFERMVKYPPISESGEWIGRRKPLQLLIGAAQINGLLFHQLRQLPHPALGAHHAEAKHSTGHRTEGPACRCR